MKILIRKTGNNEMIVNFNYHPVAVEKIKSLPYKTRKWDKIAKVWVVDLSQLENIYRLFSGCQIDADDELIELYSKKSETRERIAVEVKELIKNVPDRVNGYELFMHQKEAVPQMLLARKCILGHEQGLGKAQPFDAKILTICGWKKMGEIKIGDSIINAEGKESKITGVFPQGKKKCYRVIFNDGFSCECCDEHWWMVKNHNITCKRKILTTNEILEDLKDKSGVSKWTIPIIKSVTEFSENNLPLHPYVLGLLIGDGGFSTDSVILSLSEEKNEVMETVKSIIGNDNVRRRESGVDWGLAGVSSILKELDLQGKRSFEKFIPDIYKYSSFENRLALLQGLMDTDGYYLDSSHKEKQGQHLEYSTSSPRLAEDFCELIWSFGGTVRKRSKIPFYTTNGERKAGKRCYSLTICLPNEIEPFRLSRKKNGYKGRLKYFPSRYISKIEYVGMKEMQCISVDSPDNLYITDNYIVTHNTITALVASKLLEDRNVHVIAPISVHSSWKSFADECGVKLSGLHSWAKIPKDIPERTILIADEVHKAQGGVTTQRGKAFLNLAQKAEFLFQLSGTPMRNDRALNIFPLLEACNHPIAQNFFSFRERYCIKREIYRKGKEPIAVYDGIQNEGELRNRIGDVLFVKKKIDCLDLPEKIYQWRHVENCLTGELADDLEQLIEEYLNEKSWKEDFSDSYFDELRRRAKFQVIRRLTSLAKVDGTCDIAQDILDQGESVVICTSFLEPLHKIAEKFKDYGVSIIHGGIKAEDRGQMVKDFQSGKKRVFVFTIEAGGVGITLTKASYIIMHDRTWVPGDVDQAIDRVHRISQDKTVFVTSVSVNRMDYIIDKVLSRKSKYINRVIY